MCQDIRLQDNPDLPLIRRDAAGGSMGTVGMVTDTLVAGTGNSRIVEGTVHQPQLTGAPSEIHTEKVMDFSCQEPLTGVQTQRILTQEYNRSVPGTQYSQHLNIGGARDLIVGVSDIVEVNTLCHPRPQTGIGHLDDPQSKGFHP